MSPPGRPKGEYRRAQPEGTPMTAVPVPKVALLYPGDRAARDRADPAASRFAALFDALAAAGVNAEPAVWHDDFADEVMAQLRRVQVVLVWCNPIEDGRRRERLPLLWDCDFMLGEGSVDGAPRFVLCEINVSSVSPFPPSSISPLVEAVRCRVGLPVLSPS